MSDNPVAGSKHWSAQRPVSESGDLSDAYPEYERATHAESQRAQQGDKPICGSEPKKMELLPETNCVSVSGGHLGNSFVQGRRQGPKVRENDAWPPSQEDEPVSLSSIGRPDTNNVAKTHWQTNKAASMRATGPLQNMAKSSDAETALNEHKQGNDGNAAERAALQESRQEQSNQKPKRRSFHSAVLLALQKQRIVREGGPISKAEKHWRNRVDNATSSPEVGNSSPEEAHYCS